MNGPRPESAALAAALIAAAAFAQPPAQTPQPTFRTEANYVRVDAYPTTGDGAPVADLTQADFEILEGGAPQAIEQFERVVVRAAGPQETRVEPNSVRESRALAEQSKARLFVLFLDTYHVDVGASHAIRKPLVEALDRLIGPDDLVAVMTPEMSATSITFARRTTTIEGILTRYWHWGERDTAIPRDPQDQAYGTCYPNVNEEGAGSRCKDQNGVAEEMIDRRHEKLVLDALQDLVRYLRAVREERKAILAITNGWLLFRPNLNLARKLVCHGVPSGPEIGIDPRSGRLTTREQPLLPPSAQCDADRMQLANLDNEAQFRDILDEANRANASFYPVDPRGLAVFDTLLVRHDVPGPPRPMVPPSVDTAMLRNRLNSLRTLAEATDGLAIVNSNDLTAGFRRVVSDLSSYYLLGYYSTGKLDGKFHPITVRVKRPGVKVRARRGFLAATPAAATAAARGSAPGAAAPAENAEAQAATRVIGAAIGPLAGYARELPLRVLAAAGWKPNESASAAMWIVGELGSAAATGDAFNEGFDVTITLSTPGDATVGNASARVARGARTFRAVITPTEPLTPGDYTLRVAARGGAGSIPVRETLRLAVTSSPEATGAIYVRRGPGNREVPTADLRFRRTEQLRVEIPTAASEPPTARLLDRTGKELGVPVTAAVRDDADGSRWHTAQLTLAPLAPADYVIEIRAGGAGGERRVVAAFRVVP
jgi:VWFA-related protein